MTKPVPFGNYLLLDRLSVGGMAEVFLAKVFGQHGEARVVALKKILPSLAVDPEFVGMFLDEARIAVQLDHPNIVRLFELGRRNDTYFIAMEYVAGCDLRCLIDRGKRRGLRLPLDLALEVIAELAAGLDHAHRARDRQGNGLDIVHRDVSPQNVVVADDGRIKLIDFGIAKIANRQRATQAGILKGKFSYMSPEQAHGQPVDRRSDVFSLGIVFYELLTGTRLFAGDSDLAILEKVRAAEVLAPRRLDPAIPEEVERMVLKALARDPDRRYQWTSELNRDLTAFFESRTTDGGSQNLAAWVQEVLGDEHRREEERLQALAAVACPTGFPTTTLAAYDARGQRDGAETRVVPPPVPTSFEATATSLVRPVETGFSEEQARTELGDGWEDPTRSPLPRPHWTLTALRRTGLVRPRATPRPRPETTAPDLAKEQRATAWFAAGLVLTASLVAGGLWTRRVLTATGSMLVTARPWAKVEVEIDHRAVVLNDRGVAIVRDLTPGEHFLLATGPTGRTARWVKVVANQVANVDVSFAAEETQLPPVRAGDPPH